MSVLLLCFAVLVVHVPVVGGHELTYMTHKGKMTELSLGLCAGAHEEIKERQSQQAQGI